MSQKDRLARYAWGVAQQDSIIPILTEFGVKTNWISKARIKNPDTTRYSSTREMHADRLAVAMQHKNHWPAPEVGEMVMSVLETVNGLVEVNPKSDMQSMLRVPKSAEELLKLTVKIPNDETSRWLRSIRACAVMMAEEDSGVESLMLTALRNYKKAYLDQFPSLQTSDTVERMPVDNLVACSRAMNEGSRKTIGSVQAALVPAMLGIFKEAILSDQQLPLTRDMGVKFAKDGAMGGKWDQKIFDMTGVKIDRHATRGWRVAMINDATSFMEQWIE